MDREKQAGFSLFDWQKQMICCTKASIVDMGVVPLLFFVPYHSFSFLFISHYFFLFSFAFFFIYFTTSLFYWHYSWFESLVQIWLGQHGIVAWWLKLDMLIVDDKRVGKSGFLLVPHQGCFLPQYLSGTLLWGLLILEEGLVMYLPCSTCLFEANHLVWFYFILPIICYRYILSYSFIYFILFYFILHYLFELI